MKTRDDITARAKAINNAAPGISGPTRMLALILEVLLDIRDAQVKE